MIARAKVIHECEKQPEDAVMFRWAGERRWYHGWTGPRSGCSTMPDSQCPYCGSNMEPGT